MDLDDEERQAMADLNAAFARIRGWGLKANEAELGAAVHTIQGFIVQRMLHRVNPAEWSTWYEQVQD